MIDYLWLCLAAGLAGAINALAGGGTLLSFPTLIGVIGRQFGTDNAEVLANGTNTVALGPAALGSAWGFRRELYELRRLLIWLLPPSLVGGVLGAYLATRWPDVFGTLVPWLILAAATLFLVQPYLVPKKPQLLATDKGPVKPPSDLDDVTPRGLLGMIVLQFVIATYGGYFGAGIGILMLAGLGLMGLTNIHQMNGIKAILGGTINGIAGVVFVVQGKWVPTYALAMMVTSILGGYFAAHFSRQIPGKFVRWFVIAVGFFLAAYFFWNQYVGFDGLGETRSGNG
jgi:uncharacterized membrane protein YfcA